jgi:hypothetical protein
MESGACSRQATCCHPCRRVCSLVSVIACVQGWGSGGVASRGRNAQVARCHARGVMVSAGGLHHTVTVSDPCVASTSRHMGSTE